MLLSIYSIKINQPTVHELSWAFLPTYLYISTYAYAYAYPSIYQLLSACLLSHAALDSEYGFELFEDDELQGSGGCKSWPDGNEAGV